jgi:hypothetical protein
LFGSILPSAVVSYHQDNNTAYDVDIDIVVVSVVDVVA